MRAAQIAAVTAASLLTAGVGYAIYFDYKRQNDPQFRKQLKKESKKTSKEQKKEIEAYKKRIQGVVQEVLREVNQPGAFPTDPAGREKYFLESLTAAEALSALGPSQYLAAATAYFKAMKVYPAPVELIRIYQQGTPEPVFNFIMEMMGKDIELGGASGGQQAQSTLEALSGLAQSAPRVGQTSNLDEIDDEPTPTRGVSSSTSAPGHNTSAPSGPPSQASSQEWDNLSGASLGASSPADNEGTEDPTSGDQSSTVQGAGVGKKTQDSGIPSTKAPPSTDATSEGSASTVVVDAASSGTTTQETSASPFNFGSGSYTPSPVFKDEDKVKQEQAVAPKEEE